MTMTAFVPKDQRTPTAWRRACLEILRAEVHAEYQSNRKVSGRLIEFVRTDAHGFHLSYNFICIRGEYHLGFGVLFSLEQSASLVTPFLAGSRFDHNRTVWRLFEEDFVMSRTDASYPAGVWSHNLWRDNTLDLLVTGLKVPEQHLYPRYLTALRAGKDRLAAIFERGAELCESFTADSVADHGRILRRAIELGLNVDQVALLENVRLADAFRLAGGAPAQRNGCGDRVDLRHVPLDAILLANLPALYRERAQLEAYAKIVRSL